MHVNKTICGLMMAAALSGCSTRPRNFAAQVAVPSAELASFEADYRTCSTLVAQGRRAGFRDAALMAGASGAGVIAGVGVAFGTAGAVAGSAPFAGLAAAGTIASVAMPGIGLLAGFGVSRMIRGGKERRFKRAMTACLGEYGYTVDDWERIDRKSDAATAALAMVRQPPGAAATAMMPEQGASVLALAAEPLAEAAPPMVSDPALTPAALQSPEPQDATFSVAAETDD